MKTMLRGRIPIIFFLSAGLLMIAVSCDHTLGYTREEIDPVFKVSVNVIENGSIRAFPVNGITGTEITLAANPKPGFRLKPGSVMRGIGGNAPVVDDKLRNPPMRFGLDGDNIIYAEFEEVPRNNYSASAVETTGGTIILYSLVSTPSEGEILQMPYGPVNKIILVKLLPDEGFVLKEGSVKWTRLDPDNKPTEYEYPLNSPYRFNLPAANVIVSAEFEKPLSAASFIENGKKALLVNDYDTAVKAFETAWQMEPENNEAIFFSTLGRLASIAVDTKVRQLLGKIGYENFPGNLNNLFSLGDSWKNYDVHTVDETGQDQVTKAQRPSWLGSFSGVILPDFSMPAGAGYYAFQNQVNIVQEGKDKYGEQSMAAYYMIMFFNLMSTRIENMNYVVDDGLMYIFGDAFEAAAIRAATLGYDDTIQMEQAIIDKLFLGRLLQDGDHVGRAELDILFGYLQTIKAALEWLSGYDLEFDRYIFRFWSYVGGDDAFFPLFSGIYDEINKHYVPEGELRGDSNGLKSLINDITAYLFTSFDRYFTKREFPEHGNDIHRIPDMLPLRNHFLKALPRAQTMMTKSKADLTKALDLYLNAYNYYIGPGSSIPQTVSDNLDNYRWLGDYFLQLETAVNAGGNFYYPENLPSSGTSWNYNASNAQHGVNFGKLFTPGQLSLDKLVVSETGGKRPKFYGWDDTTTGDGMYIKSQVDFSSHAWVGFQLDLRSLKQVYVKGLEKNGMSLDNTDYVYVHTLFPNILFTRDNGKYLYELYYDKYNYFVE
ncbi:MAG: hypothetical protein LBK62_13530 [Treponema sp.]|jgi:hypothetical protein|nr:hypothetical protein [Treponema sp.]